jgi:hypothetical protein
MKRKESALLDDDLPTPIFNPPDGGAMVEDPNGEYVLASDARIELIARALDTIAPSRSN